MSNINEIISKSNLSNFKILKVKTIPKTQNIVLLKTNQKFEILFEILDFENNIIKQILLDKKLTKIYNFHPIDLENFYLSCDYNGISNCQLKVNSNGKIIYQKQFEAKYYDANSMHILKNYIFREDMVLLNLENFEEHKLINFFINKFDEDYNFTYLYFSEQRYETFTLPDDNILGFEICDKDGNQPRFYFIILKIISPTNINIIFSGKIEDCGYYYTLNKNSKEFAYRSRLYKNENNVQIRQFSLDNFQNAEVLTKDKSSKIEYFDERIIIFKKDNILEIFDRQSDISLKFIEIDEFSSFVFKNSLLFYIKNKQLNFISI
jgi:hypothetical protein